MKKETSHEDTKDTKGAKGAKARPRLVEMRAIHLTNLYKHPDAEAFGAEEEDRAALSGSVAECGLLDPLSVVAKDAAADAWWVVDGCGRLDALRAASPGGLVPCMVFDLGDFSVREFALHRNTMQRKVTTGQRVLCYLATTGADGAAPGKTPRVSRDTRNEIAAALGCSPVDVAAARELMEEAGKGENEAARVVYDDVMAGRTPIRRWKAALKGRTATKDKPKKAVDWSALCERTCASLRSIAKAWPRLRGALRDEIGEKLRAALAEAPREMRLDIGLADAGEEE